MRNKKLAATLGLLAIVIVIGAGIALGSHKNSSDNSATPQAMTQSSSDTGSSSKNGSTSSDNNKYKDGTYTATGNFRSPGGAQKIGFTITIKNDVATATSATNEAIDPRSSDYENIFIDNYRPQVVGKSIDSLDNLTLSSASLTVAGFDDAVFKIQAQARA